MNARHNIFDLAEADSWRSCWQRLTVEQRSVYLLPEYYAIYERLNHGKAYCFFYESDSGVFLYPFLKRNLDFLQLDTSQSWFDVEGAYGLNGAGCSGLHKADVDNISIIWTEYCAAENIIAEFTRINPLLASNEVLPYLQTVVANQAVVVDLKCENLLYDSYEHSVRKAIKKSERSGVTIESYDSSHVTDHYISEFSRIYETTMDRKQASDFYYFGCNYFRSIKNDLNANAQWFFAIQEGNIISVELVLFDEYACYSFLGGTLKDQLHIGANVLIKHHIINYFKQKSLSYYFLGGGTSVNDGVFNYKKTFSKNPPCNFYIGKKIHLAEKYQAAIQRWELLHPEKCEAYRNYFLKYRC